MSADRRPVSGDGRPVSGDGRPGDRSAYEARQAEFLGALLRGEGFPEGLRPDQAAAASAALRAKRARAVRVAWPALTHDLGRAFAARFDTYARSGHGPPVEGGAMADGLVFARSLDEPPSDGVRVEVLLARALIAAGRDGPRLRSGAFVGAAWLREPLRLLIVARVPGGEPRHVSVGLGS